MADSTITLSGFDGSATAGLGIATAAGSFATNTNVDDAIKDLEAADNDLRTESKKLSANLGVLTTRQDFTKSMVNNLTTGADNLTNADLNAEAANLLALNTQQSLGINSLSLASQASQSVLRFAPVIAIQAT